MNTSQSELEPPQTPDYYADLGVLQTATFPEIKQAFHRLARKHHPDKQSPGVCIDAHDFRKIRAAFEYLRETPNRSNYDAHYAQLRQAWAEYYAWQERRRQDQELRFAEERAQQRRVAEAKKALRREEEQRAAREKAVREKKAAEDKEVRRRAEEERVTVERKERERLRRRKELLAEERSQETARRAREQQAIAARERLRREKEKEAERKSEQAAIKARQERKVAAQERLKALVSEEKHNAVRNNWARLRVTAEVRLAKPAQLKPQGPKECNHDHLGWLRKRGKVVCSACGILCTKFAFQCPQCAASACQACKGKYGGIQEARY